MTEVLNMANESSTGDLRNQVQDLLYDACAALDERRYRDWMAYFTGDGRYVLLSAENFENGWPLSVIDDNRKSMNDRAEMIEKYWSIEPGRTRRFVGNIRIRETGPNADFLQELKIALLDFFLCL